MINLQQLRQQIQNQLQVNFEDNRFYYQNQNPRVPNGFTPIDQINNFDQEKNRFKTQHTTTQTTYTTSYRREVTGSHIVTEDKEIPYQVNTGETYCLQCNNRYSYEDMLDFPGESSIFCSTCGQITEAGSRVTGSETHYRTEKVSRTVEDWGNVAYQVPSGTITNIAWNTVKQNLEQQFTPPNQNEYSFIYEDINNEPNLAQIYSLEARRIIVLKEKEKNQSEFDNWKQKVRQKIREDSLSVLNNTVDQYFQEAERQINNLTQERNARPTQQDLENERQARSQSRERRQQEFDSRSAAAREVLVDEMGEEKTAYIVENQRLNWENNYRGRGNN